VFGFVGSASPLHPMLPPFRQAAQSAHQGAAFHPGVGEEHGGREKPVRRKSCFCSFFAFFFFQKIIKYKYF